MLQASRHPQQRKYVMTIQIHVRKFKRFQRRCQHDGVHDQDISLRTATPDGLGFTLASDGQQLRGTTGDSTERPKVSLLQEMDVQRFSGIQGFGPVQRSFGSLIPGSGHKTGLFATIYRRRLIFTSEFHDEVEHHIR